MQFADEGATAVQVATADFTDVEQLAAVAAATFPLACPPSVSEDDIAAFIGANLSVARFRQYLGDPQRVILTAHRDGRIVGYAMLVGEEPEDSDVAHAVTVRPAVELSKMYVLPEHHGTGVSAQLMERALGAATELGGRCAWLGVNQNNQRAQRFYSKHGFTVSGNRTFRLGVHHEHDYVLVRAL